MVYRGFHRRVNRVGKLVRRSLLILALLVVVFVPATAAQAKKGDTWMNCGNATEYSYTYDNDDAGIFWYHCQNKP
jgi:hypothetical protein